MKSFSIIRKGFDFVLPLAACSFFGVLVAQESRREQDKNAAPAPRSTNERPADNKGKEGTRSPAPANPVREGERGTRPEGGRPEAGPDAKNRFLNELNLNRGLKLRRAAQICLVPLNIVLNFSRFKPALN